MRCVLTVLLLTACVPATNSTASAVSPTPTALRVAPRDAAVCRPDAFPDTAAGRRLEQAVAVFNSTEASAAEDFAATAISSKFAPAQAREHLVERLQGEGPTIALCRVESSVARQVTAILEDTHAGPGHEFGWIIVSVDESGLVTSLDVTHITKQELTLEARPLDDEGVRRVVDEVAGGLANYVFADQAVRMATRIREARDAGEYAGITDGRVLAWRLGNDLRAVTGDAHLDVFYSRAVFPDAASEWQPSPEEQERMKAAAELDHFGLPVAEIREGNVGYLVISSFYPPEVVAEPLAEAMSELADTDVLVIDLRANAGGSREGVELISSYLFGPEPVHLFDLYNRGENRTESSHTHPELTGRRFGPSKPLYVLTSRWTISAGESFVYNLQAYDRAVVVGESTAGAAHGTDVLPVSDHWAVALPTTRPIHPLTKSNWEATGVKPDVDVPAAEALEKALELAGKCGD